MSILDVIEFRISEHSRRARAEGRGFEAEFLALVKEIQMATWNEVLGQLNGLKDKMAQVEADVQDLVKKAGSTQPPTDGTQIPQSQIDQAADTVKNLGDRMDALVQHVVTGAPTPPSDTPPSGTTTPPSDSSQVGVPPSLTPTDQKAIEEATPTASSSGNAPGGGAEPMAPSPTTESPASSNPSTSGASSPPTGTSPPPGS